MTEAEGCALLKSVFEAAGYQIAERVPLQVGGVRVELDGFDARAGVGYEFLTTEAGDRAEFTAEVVGQLEVRIRRGELALLLIDERDVTRERLRFAAERFLQRLSPPRTSA